MLAFVGSKKVNDFGIAFFLDMYKFVVLDLFKQRKFFENYMVFICLHWNCFVQCYFVELCL